MTVWRFTILTEEDKLKTICEFAGTPEDAEEDVLIAIRYIYGTAVISKVEPLTRENATAQELELWFP